jgi:hypothetical protein
MIDAADDDSSKFMGKKERRRSSALKMFLGDYLNLSQTVTITKLLNKTGDKTIVFSDVIIKVNKRNKMQERILLITEQAIYNIDPSNYKCKRRIPLQQLGGVSLSQLPDNFFALNIPSEYDYLLVSSKKTEIVTRLTEAYKNLKQQVVSPLAPPFTLSRHLRGGNVTRNDMMKHRTCPWHLRMHLITASTTRLSERFIFLEWRVVVNTHEHAHTHPISLS